MKQRRHLLAQNTRDFFWKAPGAKALFNNPDVRATFVRNDKGETTHLVLHAGEQEPATKIE